MEKALPLDLYEKAMAVFKELCDWCGKSGSTDCARCQVMEVEFVVKTHSPII